MKSQNLRVRWSAAGKLVMTLVLGFTSLTPAFAQQPLERIGQPPTAAERIQSVIDYENQFATIGEMIDELQASGSITSEEKSGIDTFLAAQKIDRKMAVKAGRAQGATMHAGQVSLTFNDDGTFKTQAGRVLRAVPGQSKDKQFIETFLALREKTAASSLSRLLLQDAKAADTFPEFLGEAFIGLGRVIATGIGLVSIAACSVTALPLDYVLSHVREWIWKGSVECQHGQFVSVGFEGFGPQLWKDYHVASNITPRITLSKDLDAAAFAICGGPIGRLIPGNPMTRARYRMVDKNVIAQAFHGAVPRCTDQTAAHLTHHLRNQGKAIENALVHDGARAHSAVHSVTGHDMPTQWYDRANSAQ